MVNISGRDIVLYSKDAELYKDFKSDNAFYQNVNANQDFWLFLGCCKAIASWFIKSVRTILKRGGRSY